MGKINWLEDRNPPLFQVNIGSLGLPWIDESARLIIENEEKFLEMVRYEGMEFLYRYDCGGGNTLNFVINQTSHVKMGWNYAGVGYKKGLNEWVGWSKPISPDELLSWVQRIDNGEIVGFDYTEATWGLVRVLAAALKAWIGGKQ